MKNRLFWSIVLAAGIAFPSLGGESFVGEAGTIPEGWRLSRVEPQTSEKAQYASGAKPDKNVIDKTGIVDDADEGKVMSLTAPAGETWQFDKPGPKFDAPGIVETILVGKAEKGETALKAITNWIAPWETITFGDKEWTERRMYKILRAAGNADLHIQLPQGKTVCLKSWAVKHHPLPEGNESGFFGNPGEMPFLWAASAKGDYSKCGITEKEGIAPYSQSFRLSGNEPLQVRSFLLAPFGEEGSELEFSAWMKGKAARDKNGMGLMMWMCSGDWKWQNHKQCALTNEWAKFTLVGKVTKDGAGKNGFVLIGFPAGGDVLIGKYYIGKPMKEEGKADKQEDKEKK